MLILMVFIGVILMVPTPGDCNPEHVLGSGNVSSEFRNVSGFTSVSLIGVGHLIIEQTGAESLKVEAEDNIQPYLTSVVTHDRLLLGISENTSIQATKQISYRVTVADLNEIEVSGSARVEAAGIENERLRLTCLGSSAMTISGTADRLDININGSAIFRGEDLKSKEATVMISGSGSAVVKVSAKLDVRLFGSGSVEYIGNPTLTQTLSGSASVRRRQNAR